MLTKGEVDHVLELLAEGLSLRKASIKSGVSYGAVRDISIGRHPTCFTRKLHGESKKKLSEATKQKLFDTRDLSIAESAGISKQTQDAVRAWRKKHGYHEKRNAAMRYTLNIGERVMWYDRKTQEELVGRITAKNGNRYHVHFEGGRKQWLGEQALASMPSPEEIAERAAAIAAQWPADHPNFRDQIAPVLPHEWHVYDGSVGRVL